MRERRLKFNPTTNSNLQNLYSHIDPHISSTITVGGSERNVRSNPQELLNCLLSSSCWC
jgi:hypothetical protein